MSELTRRGFVVTSLATGFALAVQPVSAETITTDAAGLDAAEASIPADGGALPGYWAAPATGRRRPVVLVVHEIFGVHEHIKDACRRLAKAGYFAVAPLLSAREGDVSGLSDIQSILSRVMSKVPTAQVLSDLDATVDWAGRQEAADTSRLGITGFCWGGRIVWMYAAHSPRLKAGVAWYGPLARAANPSDRSNPVDVAGTLKAPVLGLYAGQDAGIPPEAVDLMRARLAAAGGRSEIVVYPDAPHGFNADYRPSYRKGAAEDGWRRMLDWFGRHGVA